MKFWVEENAIDRLAKNARRSISTSGAVSDFGIYVLARYYTRLLREAHARRDNDAILDVIPKQIAFSLLNRRAGPRVSDDDHHHIW